ncbi:MAG: PLP-dependent aminotransferase family protein [Bacteroidota bacterium]
MLPYRTIIELDRNANKPLHIQICNSLIKLVRTGSLQSGLKLPGGRKMATLLGVSRKTVIKAYEELAAQGWIEVKPNQGCFINSSLPLLNTFSSNHSTQKNAHTHFKLGTHINTKNSEFTKSNIPIIHKIDDGYPDVKLAPLSELGKNYSYIMNNPQTSGLMSYTQAYYGDIRLREEIVKYLSTTRNINVSIRNILITRGSLMAFYLLSQTLFSEGDNIIVSNPGYNEGYYTLQVAKCSLIRVPVDEHGIQVNLIEKICKEKKIRAVFIVPHHQYPTTVSLTASRRMQLLILAKKYKFAIIEDDYDYDFHYASSPILPVASTDSIGTVAYVGSFSKIIAPSLRVGYIVAPENLIHAATNLSRFIDSHGNNGLERAIAMLFDSGEIRRYLKKANKIYRKRRDHFCYLLEKEIGEHIEFDIPAGGLAVWIKFRKHILYENVTFNAAKKGLQLPSNKLFSPPNKLINAARIGFASLREDYMVEVVGILKQSIEKSY